MLQFVAKVNDNYSIPELVQMAIEGGCKWVQLHVPEMDDSQIRELASELIPLCKESETMLTIEDHIEMAKELAIHGVLLDNSKMSAHEAREFCGPEAIVGVAAKGVPGILALKDLDVDYVTLPSNLPFDLIADMVAQVREAGVVLPLVAYGDYLTADIPALLACGVSGVALSSAISEAVDPVAATKEILTLLKKK